ncbi:hypothetical protein [Neorhizobium sp. NCHU2750]|uniref:hypothetical protein n=1 Tax=Neorhizobium sp. NCHU2750 TaxID=1825976 RepID=UPI000E745771|nr:hypothetical protein NCHU2750_15620 [Neorhizobium sp. NCHU2750]
MSIELSENSYGHPEVRGGRRGNVPYLKLVYSSNDDLIGHDDGEPESVGSFVVAILAFASVSMFAAIWFLI